MQLGIHLEKWCHTYLQLPPKTSGTIFYFLSIIALKATTAMLAEVTKVDKRRLDLHS